MISTETQEHLLKAISQSPVKLVYFAEGMKYLLSVSDSNELTSFDLYSLTPLTKTSIKLNSNATCLCSSGSSWSFIGFDDGKLGVLNADDGEFSEYEIPYRSAALSQATIIPGNRPSSGRDKKAIVSLEVSKYSVNISTTNILVKPERSKSSSNWLRGRTFDFL